MRIGLVLDELARGGTELQFTLTACGLAEAGHKVSMFVLRPLRPGGVGLRGRLDQAGVSVTHGPRTVAGGTIAYARWLRRTRPDVVHVALIRTSLMASIATNVPGHPPLVMSRRYLASARNDSALRRAVVRDSLRRAREIVANSQAAAMDSAREERMPLDRYTVIPNIVPESAFEEVRAAQVDTDLPVVVNVASLRPQKGHLALVEATRLLADAGLPVTLLVAGNDRRWPDTAEAVRAAIAEAGVDVRLLGDVPDVRPLLARAEVVVHASVAEGFSNALLEAMAAGRPVVASEAAGHEVEGAVRVVGREPAQIADAVAGLLADPDEAADLGARARQRARTFDTAAAVAAHLDVYRRVLGWGADDSASFGSRDAQGGALRTEVGGRASQTGRPRADAGKGAVQEAMRTVEVDRRGAHAGKRSAEVGGRAAGGLSKRGRLLIGTTLAEQLTTSFFTHLPSLIEAGWDVELVCADGEWPKGPPPVDVPVHRIAMRKQIDPRADLASLAAWVHLLRERRPDVLIGASPKAGLLTMVAGRLVRTPRRIFLHRGARWETLTGRSRHVTLAADRLTCRSATDVVAVSDSLAGLLQAEHVTRSRALVLAGGGSKGVDLERFVPAAPPVLAARSGSTAPGDDAPVGSRGSAAPVLGFVGRLAGDKGLDVVLAAFDEVARRFPGARLVIAGDIDDADPPMPPILARLRSDPAIDWLGWQTDVVTTLQGLTVLVFPSAREGLPNAVIEAAACGVPTVGWDVTGVRDAISDPSSGRVVPFGDAEAFAEAVVRTCERVFVAPAQVRADCVSWAQRFDSRRVTAAWLELLAAPPA